MQKSRTASRIGRSRSGSGSRAGSGSRPTQRTEPARAWAVERRVRKSMGEGTGRGGLTLYRLRPSLYHLQTPMNAMLRMGTIPLCAVGFCLAGAAHAQTPLLTFESPTPVPSGLGSPGGVFGDPIAGVPDLDGDGRDDVAVGARGEHLNIDTWQSGRVHIFSGATGALLYSLDSPNPEVQGYFGVAVAGVDDLD